MSETISELRKVNKSFAFRQGLFGKNQAVRAVKNVSLQIKKGEVVGIVGESGCGKTTLGNIILGLEPPDSGEVFFWGRSLLGLPKRDWRALRRHLQVIFQDPYASLNPRITVRQSLAHVLYAHDLAGSLADALRMIDDVLRRVRLPKYAGNHFPREFSGGERQRIAIARALLPKPALLVADEPTSSLDVSIQAEIIDLLKELQREMNLTIVFISHDLAVVRHLADMVAVMYLGEMVEIGKNQDVFDQPRHPYTKALIDSCPVPDPDRKKMLTPIKGEVPSAVCPPTGCSFHPRCLFKGHGCDRDVPVLEEKGKDHLVACFYA